MQIDFTQIYYSDTQKAEIFPFATPYFNDTLTPFFENKIIADIVAGNYCEDEDCDSITECGMRKMPDRFAICSWALKQKMTARIPPRVELTEEVLRQDYDVLSFTKNAPGHDMLGALEVWHPGATAILSRIWSELGLEMPKKPKFPIYQNHFCATKQVYKEYVLGFLMKAMYVMEFDDEIRKLCWQNSNYSMTTLGNPVDFDRIEKFFGVRYVPMHAFLLERCFSLWIDNRNLKVVYL